MTDENKPSITELQRLEGSMTPGHWQWFGNTKIQEIYLATVNRGRVYVMDFVRWGMTGAQPRFQCRLDSDVPGSGIMRSVGELGKEEHPLGPRFEAPYRRQFVGIGHPDATGTVDLRNAAPVLLEIASAALAWRATECKLESATTDDCTVAAQTGECVGDSHHESCPVARSLREFLDALAKVRP